MKRLFGGLIVFALFAGVGFFISPEAQAAGELITSEQTNAVYYRADDGNRYVFPNKQTYDTWYEDFSGVRTVSAERLASYPVGGNVPYRPGTRLVKIQSDPKVYAVEPGGLLRWVQSESIARDLYGSGWADKIDDIPVGFFNTYTISDPIETATYPEGSFLRDSSTGAYYVIWQGQKRLIQEAALEQNRFQTRYAVTTDLLDYTSGPDVASREDVLSSPAQLGLGSRLESPVVVEALQGRREILQENNCAPMAGFAFSFAEETTISELRFDIKASQDTDSDFDKGGLIRGDDEKNIEANLKNLRLRAGDGRALFQPQNLTTLKDEDDNQVIVFEGNATFSPGRHVLYMDVDVPKETSINQRYTAELLLTRSVFEAGRQTVSGLTPERVVAPSVSVQSPDLRVGGAGGYETEKMIKGVESHELIGMRFENARCDSVTIRDLTLTGYIDEGEGNADFQAGADADGGSSLFVSDVIDAVEIFDPTDENKPVIARQETIQSNGHVVFSGINLRVDSAGRREIGVRVFFNSEAPFGQGPDRVSFDIVSQDDVDIYSETLAEGVDLQRVNPFGGSNPSTYVELAENGTLTVEGMNQASGRVLMGAQRRALYRVNFNASEEEAFYIRQLSFRNLNTQSERSIQKIELRYQTESGETKYAQSGFQAGSVTFSNLDAFVPKEDPDDTDEEEARVWLDVSIYDSGQGAVSGDEVGFAFDRGSFVAESATSGKRFTSDDFGDALIDETESRDGVATVRKSEPVVELTEEQPRATTSRSEENSVLRFTMKSRNRNIVYVDRLVFKVETSDAGYKLNDQEDDNDLLEYWADVNGDAADDDDIVTLRNEDGDAVGEGNSGEIEYFIYDESERALDGTPQGITTSRSDYGWIVYKMRQPITVFSAPREYELELDLRGLADGSRNVRVFLQGAQNFIWNDGTATGINLNGGGVQRLPLSGNRYNYN